MSLGNKVLKSSLILLGIRLIHRSIGIVSIIILARILTPEDFSIVSVCTIAIFFFEALSEAGTKEYIIHKQDVHNEDLNTAWSLNLLLKSLSWLIFIILTPTISSYFDEPKLELPLYVISLILPISAMSNSGVILLHKEFNYKPIMKLAIYQKVISSFLAIALAITYRSYWAMVISMVISYLIPTIGSYYIHSFRPKFSLIFFKHQYKFSIWILLKGILGYTRSEIDSILVSKIFGLPVLGGYTLMKNLSVIPGREIIGPVTTPLLAAFSQNKLDHNNLAQKISLSILATSLLMFPITLFIWFYHDLIVIVFLGDKWITYSPILGALSLFVISFTLSGIFNQLLTALSKVKILFYFELLSFITVLVTLLSVNFNNPTEFALLRSCIALFFSIVLIYLANKIVFLPILKFIKLTIPVYFCSALPIYMINHIRLLLGGEYFPNVYIELFTLGLFYLSTYMLLLCVAYFTFRKNNEIIQLKSIFTKSFQDLKLYVFNK